MAAIDTWNTICKRYDPEWLVGQDAFDELDTAIRGGVGDGASTINVADHTPGDPPVEIMLSGNFLKGDLIDMDHATDLYGPSHSTFVVPFNGSAQDIGQAYADYLKGADGLTARSNGALIRLGAGFGATTLNVSNAVVTSPGP